MSSVMAPMVSPVAAVTLFAGVPVNRASLPPVKPVVPPFQFKFAVFHVPLAVPDHVSVAACTAVAPGSKIAAANASGRKNDRTDGNSALLYFIG